MVSILDNRKGVDIEVVVMVKKARIDELAIGDTKHKM